LLGDPVRLHQIILNLVSNAIKFTTDGEITVNVNLLSEADDTVNIEFEVKDTGIGIGSEKIEHIFENFQQATTETTRLYGGTGLGLAIAKQLVETQGGSINVVSKLDEGSTFSFILPYKKTNAEADSNLGTVEFIDKIKNIKVLVVEDIALNQLLMKTLLDDYGFEHDIASNGKIAINMLQEKQYDIVLMDLQMPEMNGFEAAKYIRFILKYQIPIIALTADVTTADLEKCKAMGMNDYISKPVDERLLYKKIVELLKKPAPSPESSPIAGRTKCVDLTYLYKRTRANPELMMEMIDLYLEQTPSLIGKMKQGLSNQDWALLYTSAHKIIPSFSIMGIQKDNEDIARKIQEYSASKQNLNEIPELILKLDAVCSKACEELKEEYEYIQKSNP
jgi:CheY-like chemotaxis protein